MALLWYEELKKIRINYGWSLRAVEKLSGISNSYLCQLENGQIKDPSFFKITALLRVYSINIYDIFPI